MGFISRKSDVRNILSQQRKHMLPPTSDLRCPVLSCISSFKIIAVSVVRTQEMWVLHVTSLGVTELIPGRAGLVGVLLTFPSVS